MKSIRIIAWICALCMLCAPMTMSAKVDKRTRMAQKMSQKRSKELAREGWLAFPGEAPLAEQLTACNMLLEEQDEDGMMKYLIANAVSEYCPSLDQAELQAIAKGRITFWEEYLLDKKAKEISKGAVYENSTTEPYRAELRFKDEKLKETWVDSDGVVHEKIYWDAVIRNLDDFPLYAKAWCKVKMYRKTEEGYQVSVIMCNYAKYFLVDE